MEVHNLIPYLKKSPVRGCIDFAPYLITGWQVGQKFTFPPRYAWRTMVTPHRGQGLSRVLLDNMVGYPPAFPNKSFSVSRPPLNVISNRVCFTLPNRLVFSACDKASSFVFGWMQALNKISCSAPFPRPGMRCSVASKALILNVDLAPSKMPWN